MAELYALVVISTLVGLLVVGHLVYRRLVTMRRHQALTTALDDRGFEAGGVRELVRGPDRLLADPTDWADLTLDAVPVARPVSPRRADQGSGVPTGDEGFDQRFVVGPGEGFHGLSADVRWLLLDLADLGDVVWSGDRLSVRLHAQTVGIVHQAIDRLLQLAEARRGTTLEAIVRDDPWDVVAAEALRVLSGEDERLAERLAAAVSRPGASWRGERARVLRDEPELAACLDDDPDALHLLDGLDDDALAGLLLRCARPAATFKALDRVGRLSPEVAPLGRAAWLTLRDGLRGERFGDVATVMLLWRQAVLHLRSDDLHDLGDVCLVAPASVVPRVVTAMVKLGGMDALPLLQKIEREHAVAWARGAVREGIDELIQHHPDARGALSVARHDGGQLSVATDPEG